MDVDNLIADFDFDKIENDCPIHAFLKTYSEKKANLSSGDDYDASLVKMQLDDYASILERLLKNAACFPSGCENCAGIQKCAGCLNQDILADAFIKLQKYL